MNLKRLLPALLTVVVLMESPRVGADDWPQWMGPKRDNIWREAGMISQFPPGGPPVVWRQEIAGGYAGPAVAKGRVYVTDYRSDDEVKVANFEREQFSGLERVLCLDEASGEILWKHQYPVSYDISYPAGPRCTPLVDDDRVYTLGAEGRLICLDAESGEVRWQCDLTERYSTETPLWGYAGHPLIDGNRLITLAGGEGSHAVALDKMTGEEVWRSGSADQQGYSPPTMIESGGLRQLILTSPEFVRSVDPETGAEYWSIPYEATSGSIIMSPVKCGDYLYVAGFNQHSLLLELSSQRPAAKELWRDKRRDAISPVNVQPLCKDGVLYGFDQAGVLAAVAIPSGERLWETSQPVSERRVGNGTAFIIPHGDRFWLFTENGDLVIAEIDRRGYHEVDRANVIAPSNVASGRQVVWSMPAFANRRAYIRNDKEIICLNLAQQ